MHIDPHVLLQFIIWESFIICDHLLKTKISGQYRQRERQVCILGGIHYLALITNILKQPTRMRLQILICNVALLLWTLRVLGPLHQVSP